MSVCVQVSQVYQSIELSRLAELAPFTTPLHLEKVVVETARSNNILVRSSLVMLHCVTPGLMLNVCCV